MARIYRFKAALATCDFHCAIICHMVKRGMHALQTENPFEHMNNSSVLDRNGRRLVLCDYFIRKATRAVNENQPEKSQGLLEMAMVQSLLAQADYFSMNGPGAAHLQKMMCRAYSIQVMNWMMTERLHDVPRFDGRKRLEANLMRRLSALSPR